MVDRVPRHSTDQEAAPLLRGDDEDEDAVRGEHAQPTFAERINSIAQEPLTPLSKLLLLVALVLLLLSSVFIGLFAGEYSKLKQHERDGSQPPATVTFTATTTAVFTTTAVPPPGPTSPPVEQPCISAQCIQLSASILSSLDVSQDPCENFFDFANGGWIAAHPLPADKGSFGQFEALSQENKRVIQHFLETPTATSSFTTSYDEQILQKLRDFYSSCLNEDRLDELGTEPLIHFVKTLQRLFRGEGLEITQKPDEQDEDKLSGLTAAMAFIHSRGIDALFSFSIDGDVGVDPNFMTLWFDQANLGLPSKEYYEEESILEIYQSVVERLLFTLSEEEEKLQKQPTATIVENANVWPTWPWPPYPDDDDDDEKPNRTEIARKLAKQVVKFETKLANATLDADVYQDPFATYNRLPLSNLTASLPQIDFPSYFATFAPRNFPENVIITYPPYPVSVSEILSSTSSEVVEAYLVVRAALALSPNLGMATEAWQAQRTLLETLTGIKKGAVGDRAEYCVGKVEESLGFAAGRYFVNETFGGDSREKGTKVITDIVEAFKASLPDVKWLDKTSADAAAEKAEAIRVKVGYPTSPNTLDARSILNYYSGVKVNADTYFDNILSAAGSDQFKTWVKLGQRRNFDEWEMWPSMVNAYFNPPSNEASYLKVLTVEYKLLTFDQIVFPAGILQPPFFSQDWPSYLSYGAFGHVAAHELTVTSYSTHFDSAGRLYNQNGKLENWWTNSSNAGFEIKQECIVNQYSAYTVDDGKGGKIHVNGNLTSGENIGDTGLIQAYRAWKAQLDSSLKAGDEYLLPGLNYTREQLFFISFARIWGGVIKTAAQVQRVRTDPHSPNIYRVDGTVFNIPEFAAAFNCPKTAKLNPPAEKQCLFWS
ncbi:Metalloprotease [Mycena galericulata]|nr:Metalloprotease [Mycena galericulata]